MAGSGKSTVGRALAKILGFAFTDLDDYIREKEGQTIQEIIDTRGEEALLQIEDRCMRELKLSDRVVSPAAALSIMRTSWSACVEKR
jgi:shikimate kinase